MKSRVEIIIPRPPRPKFSSLVLWCGLILLLVATLAGVIVYTTHGDLGPSQVIFSDSISTACRNVIEPLTDNLTLSRSVKVSSYRTTTAPTTNNTIVYDVLVPVAANDSTIFSITATTLDQLAEGQTVDGVSLISIHDLSPSDRLLAVDDSYYLDTFTTGAIFENLTFAGQPDDIANLIQLLNDNLPALPNSTTVLTLAQTGVTALSRGMNAALSTMTAADFAKYIGPYLSQFDFTHTSNEASFSTAASSSNICSRPTMIDALTAIGLDIVELTGNHNQDCGDEAALSTLATYASLGIQTFGGGQTATAAAIPLEISAKDTHITLLGYNYSTGGYTLDDTPGANFYTEDQAIQDIAAAKARNDFIIVDVQYYECNSYNDTSENYTCDYANSAAGDQIGFFRHLIDLGADLVVGTAAHQPQTFEFYGNGAIYYGLGNLFFDQAWWPGTTRSIILVHYFFQNQLLQTRLVPTVYDQTYQTKLMEQSDAYAFLARLISARPE